MKSVAYNLPSRAKVNPITVLLPTRLTIFVAAPVSGLMRYKTAGRNKVERGCHTPEVPVTIERQVHKVFGSARLTDACKIPGDLIDCVQRVEIRV